MAAKIRKGDTVQIISGAHKGATGRVMKVIVSKEQVIIEGQNRRFKHVKPSRQNPQGGRIQVEQPIHISNVLPVSPKSNKATRVRFETDKKGVKRRVSLDGSEIGIVKKA